MKILIYLFLTILIITPRHGGAQIKADIQNTKTSAHVNIPGTRLYIISPPDFMMSTTFPGLQKNKTTLINISDLVGGSMAITAKTFTREAFEKKGMKVFDFRKIKVNGFDARYISTQFSEDIRSYQLLFGDSTFSELVTCAFPSNDPDSGNEILNALNTIYYNKNTKIAAFAADGFSLAQNISRFKLFRYSAGFYLYTTGGKVSDTGTDPSLMIIPLPYESGVLPERYTYNSVFSQQQCGVTSFALKNSVMDRINGYRSSSEETDMLRNGKSLYMFSCFLTDGKKGILVQCISRKNRQADLLEFKKIVQAIRFK